MTSGNIYYEYKIKNGDTFSGIIHSMFGHVLNDTRYAETVKHLLALNPQIKNPDRIRAGDMLRLGVLPPTPQTKPPTVLSPPTFMTQPTHPGDMNGFWALSWLENNANYLTIPGSIAPQERQATCSAPVMSASSMKSVIIMPSIKQKKSPKGNMTPGAKRPWTCSGKTSGQ